MDNAANFSSNSQTYYWKVTVNDGHGAWTNATYHFTTIGANKGIISKGQNAYSLEMSPDGATLYAYINGNYVSTAVPEPITDWYHMVMTYDGSKIRLYINGELKNSINQTGAINTNANDLLLGEYMTGTLDELRISSTARSAAWINTTYINTDEPTSFATFGTQVGILSTFSYRKQIEVNSSMVDSDLSNFPVLVSITDADLKNNADTTGYDIIFTSSEVNWRTGTYSDILPHEIEKWDSSTGKLVAWVKLDSISSTTNTSFYIYYSSICVLDKQDASGVWDDDYVAVWHKNDATSTTIKSSTINTLTGTKKGVGEPTETTGYIGNAQEYDGTGDYITLGTNVIEQLLNGTSGITVSAWIKPDDFSETKYIWYGLVHSSSVHTTFRSNDNKLRLNARSQSTDDLQSVTSTVDIGTGVWHHLVGVVDYANGDLILYINGSYDTNVSATFDSSSLSIGTPSIESQIGNHPTSGRDFDGIIDELRVSKTVRSADWINAEYNTMNSPSTFLAFGAQEIPNVAPMQSNPNPANDVTGENLNPTLSIQVNDTNNDLMNVTFRTNATGAWGDIGSNNSVYNGTYSQTNSSMSSYNTKYWWSVNATDGQLWTNRTYSFTTRDEYIPEIPGDFTAATHNSTQINLTWTKGVNATHTYIEYNATAEGPWARGQGNFLCNITGEIHQHTGLESDNTYYYQAWSYNEVDKRYSTSYASANATTAEA